MMRICFCIDTMESGGSERVASVLCNQFVNLNNEVDLIMVSKKTPTTFYFLDRRIRLIPLLSNSKTEKVLFFKKVKFLKQILKKNEYDVVISFLPNVNTCVWLSSLRNKKFIHIVSERNNPVIDPKNRFKRLIKEIAYKNSDGLVCQTSDSFAYFSKYDIPIIIIKNPISSEKSINHLYSNNNNEIIAVGRLENQKNFKLLINAFRVFVINHPEATLKIYGIGSLEKKLLKLIHDLELDNKVYLYGNSKNWIIENSNCAFFTNTSLYEGMPNSLLEALANEFPCIASDCPAGGSKDLLKYENGLLFKNNDIKDLINKMELLYHNRELIKLFAENNKKIKEIFSANAIAEQWLSFFQTIIERKDNK